MSSLGENVKVHFAGAEQINFSMVAREAGVHYFLYTVFPFISQKVGIKGYPVTVKNIFPPLKLDAISRHVIMDSGLFSLMFGAHKGKRDEAFIRQWKENLVGFVNENNIRATCVEIDCQKVLGVNAAWTFRQELRNELPHNRIINVFHYEDGRKGLERLIEFSEYLAVSVPEIRIVHPKTYKEDVYALASFIKNKKPEIDIHLLGCTEGPMLRRCNFCTSADSTSWLAANRYGNIDGYHPSQIRPELKEKAMPAVRRVLAACDIEQTEKRLEYHANYFVSAQVHKRKYETYCGNQE